MSKSDAPSPISSSGVKPTRSVGRGSSGCAARCATAVTISATPALSSAPSSVSPLDVTMSWPARPPSSRRSAGSSTVPPFGQLDPAAVVVAVHDRLDRRARRVRARVDVGDEADDRRAVDVAGQRRGHVAVVVLGRVLEAGLAQLLDEHAPELELAGRRRALRAAAGRLRVDARVADEAVQEAGRELGGQVGGRGRHATHGTTALDPPRAARVRLARRLARSSCLAASTTASPPPQRVLGAATGGAGRTRRRRGIAPGAHRRTTGSRCRRVRKRLVRDLQVVVTDRSGPSSCGTRSSSLGLALRVAPSARRHARASADPELDAPAAAPPGGSADRLPRHDQPGRSLRLPDRDELPAGLRRRQHASSRTTPPTAPSRPCRSRGRSWASRRRAPATSRCPVGHGALSSQLVRRHASLTSRTATPRRRDSPAAPGRRT